MAKVLSIAPEVPVEPSTIQAVVDEFLDRNWTRHTKRNYRSDLTRFARVFGSRPVKGIRATRSRPISMGCRIDLASPWRLPLTTGTSVPSRACSPGW